VGDVGIEPDEGVMILEEGFVKAAARRYWEREPKVRMLA
jgi:catalase